LVAINVLKSTEKRHWTVPTSGKSPGKDIDRGQRQKSVEPSQEPRESGISAEMQVSLNFSNVKDADLSLQFKGIGRKMKDNIQLFPKTPVDLDEFLALVDEYDHAIIVAMDGSKKAISQRNKLREQAPEFQTGGF
jgi:hypothetical protein